MDWLNRLKQTTETTPAEFSETIQKNQTAFQGAAEIVTREGESIWIATEPEDVQLIPSGAVYFLGDEIEQLHKAGKEAARAALTVKQVFGNGAKVTGTKGIANAKT